MGVDRHQIPIALRALINDCMYWIKHDTWPAEEIALRFKHRIVQIHCFANGNGGHSRLMGDMIIDHVFGAPVFTWGSRTNLTKAGTGRDLYIRAVKAAGGGDLNPLAIFSRS